MSIETASPKIVWKEVNGELKPFMDNKEVVWTAQEGSQKAFLSCPIFEALLEGTRGGGKTDTLIMDFAQHTGQGFGAEWRGVLFRQSYPQLSDVIAKTKKWFPRVFPKAKFNESATRWVFPDGEELLLRHMATQEDYWNYHGHCVRIGEVLTPTGWRDIWDVKMGDIVYAVSEDRVLIPIKVAIKTVEDFDSDLIQHTGKGTFVEFTPNHKIAVVQENGKIHPVRYLDVGRQTTIAREVCWEGGVWIDTFQAPEVSFRDTYPIKQVHTLSGNDYCELMGWFLSEGCGSGKRILIAQKKSKFRQNIKNLLDRCGFRYSEDRGGFSFSSPRWTAWFRRFGKCPDKWVPENIKNAPLEQLKIFFNALVAGDGHRKGDNVYYYTTSKQLADDVAEIAVKLGYATWTTNKKRDDVHLRAYVVACSLRDMNLYTDNRDRNLKTNSDRIQVKRVPYKGKVCCIGLPKHHMFVLRQKGCTWVSGNSYPWIAFEELTSWADDKCYKVMMSCSRSTKSGMPRKYRATTNPYGIGHNWVKARFQLPVPPGKIIGKIVEEMDEVGIPFPPRIAIHSTLIENKVLLTADPGYEQKIRAAARNPSELRAWLHGDWDIVAGGMFDDVWSPGHHVVPTIRPDMIPKGWRIDRSYDHGQSKPFSVGWWCQSNGEPIRVGRHILGKVPGDVYRFAEWYGWCKSPNEGLRMTAVDIADGIMERENRMGFPRGRVKAGPADTAIYDDYEPGRSVAADMSKRGVNWLRADKTSGSRKQGWQQIRQYMKDALPVPGGYRERPGMFVCENCDQFLRTVPVLPRDDKDLDDVDTDAEDHIGDEVRYRIRMKKSEAKSSQWK